MIPKKIFFTHGVGRGRDKLSSFEAALREAGIEMFNLVRVSSIFPPNCKIITKEKGLKLLDPGEIVFCVIAENSTNEPNRQMSASIGLAIPSDRKAYGYLSEHHDFGMTAEKAGDFAEDLAATYLASTMGLEFNPDKDWNERKQEFRASGKIIKTRNITRGAIGHKDGLWTTIVAAAVLIP